MQLDNQLRSSALLSTNQTGKEKMNWGEHWKDENASH